MKEQGVQRIAAVIEQNIEQARYLGALVEKTPELELMAPVALNIACYRYKVDGLDSRALNSLNEEILMRIQESGTAVPSNTLLDGAMAIRVNITNHRTELADLDQLVADSVRHGQDALVALSL